LRQALGPGQTERTIEMRRKDEAPTSGGAAQLLAQARSRLRRLEPWEASAALDEWAALVDIRPAAQRAVEGEIPGALVVERNVLEWRLDPTSADRLPLAHADLHAIVICSYGMTSSLAAAALQDVGIHRATDVIGGVRAWRAAGLPITGRSGPVEDEGDALAHGPAAASFASGVVVVSALDNAGAPVGVAVHSFMSLSADPPLVAVALPCTSRTLPLLLLSGVFGVSVLAADQASIARRFASGLPLTDRFDGVEWSPGDSGVPLIEGALSTLECYLERETAAGEQVIVVGRVNRAHLPDAGIRDAAPLLYHRGSLLDERPPLVATEP
jgi:flavin reductase (DIM6/NTAB) family NADH-FMN oxidoreductase RutF/rhodanese-related sulfurtransferase